MIYAPEFYTPTTNDVSLVWSSKATNADSLWYALHLDAEPATPITKYYDVPGRDGLLDMSEALGLRYNNRKITITLGTVPGADKQTAVSELQVLNGKSLYLSEPRRLIPAYDDELLRYAKGRVTVSKIQTDGSGLSAILEINAEPFAQVVNTGRVTLNPFSGNTFELSLYRSEYPAIWVITDPATIYDQNGENPITYAVGKYAYSPNVYLSSDSTSHTIYGSGRKLVIMPKLYRPY